MAKELPKAYEAKVYEDRIYKMWEDNGCFKPEVNEGGEGYTISMPPPNATGTLHLGHAVMLAVEDILTRYHRMTGKAALWVPGTDHASIATQSKVERIIETEEDKNRHDLGREAFLRRVEEFVEGSQATIKNQTRKIGASCDWSRERYTLDEGLSRAVQTQFVQMYNDGLIYRGYRIVNWSVKAGSTLADDEVEYRDVEAKFYYMKYGPFVVATSRPETKLADTAVAVNPADERYKKYVGQEMDVDLAGHKIHIKVIADENVDMELGTGVLGVTPAHSFVDYEMAQKNDVPMIPLIQEDGTLNENGGKYAGMTVKEAREAFVKDLEEAGQIERVEDYVQSLSVCYRTGGPVEPLPKEQWFIDVNKEISKGSVPLVDVGGEIEVEGKSLKEVMLEVVRKKQVRIIPERFEKTYFHWIENLRDWCISRQIWFGHRIPAWYREGEVRVSLEQPEGKGWVQDEDTLDTWFSSGMWTYSTLGWPEKTADLQKFHPTSCMETGYDILFFWVARMILMTTYATRQIPFRNVYLHGLVRTRDGAKMSKSHPETCIDPLEVIGKYGADAVRLALVVGSTPGNDMKLYEEKIKGYRNFVNKIWNTARFALLNVEELEADGRLDFDVEELSLADKWVLSKLEKLIRSATKNLEDYRLGEAAGEIYEFLWHEFADWYLEVSKVEKNEVVIMFVLKTLLRLLHPFTPFVTEAIWEEMGLEKLILEKWPVVDQSCKFAESESGFELYKEVLTTLRNLRTESNIAPSKEIELTVHAHDKVHVMREVADLLKQMGKVSKLTVEEQGAKVEGAVSAVVRDVTLYIPLAGAIDMGAEKERLTKEIKNLEGYLVGLRNKLGNKQFAENAPEAVVEAERVKLDEAEAKKKKLEENLNSLK